jgi:hypothetical protein
MREDPPYKTIELNGVKLYLYPAARLNAYAKKNRWVLQELKEDYYEKIIPGYYLYTRNLNKEDICRAAGLRKIGQYDLAVPQPWLDRPENTKKWRAGEWAVWFYPNTGKGVTFGRPVWRSQIWRTLKALIIRKLNAGRK